MSDSPSDRSTFRKGFDRTIRESLGLTPGQLRRDLLDFDRTERAARDIQIAQPTIREAPRIESKINITEQKLEPRPFRDVDLQNRQTTQSGPSGTSGDATEISFEFCQNGEPYAFRLLGFEDGPV